jgi:hypothetical protein
VFNIPIGQSRGMLDWRCAKITFSLCNEGRGQYARWLCTLLRLGNMAKLGNPLINKTSVFALRNFGHTDSN